MIMIFYWTDNDLIELVRCSEGLPQCVIECLCFLPVSVLFQQFLLPLPFVKLIATFRLPLIYQIRRTIRNYAACISHYYHPGFGAFDFDRISSNRLPRSKRNYFTPAQQKIHNKSNSTVIYQKQVTESDRIMCDVCRNDGGISRGSAEN